MIVPTVVPLAVPLEAAEWDFQTWRCVAAPNYWRKKITVAGARLTLAFSLGTGKFKPACAIALHLGTAVETLRMAYGQSPGMTPEQLKRVFSDALRWQLQRIQADQVGTTAPAGDHASLNLIHGEAWAFLAKHGLEAPWSFDQQDRLIENGWAPTDAKAVGEAVFDYQTAHPVSKIQLDSYVAAFRIEETTNNLDRVKRTICAARAAACREATSRLSADVDSFAGWIPDALADETPFAFSHVDESRSPQPVTESPVGDRYDQPKALQARSVATVTKVKKLLLVAAEECIARHEQQQAWHVISAGQVRTALRMFDHACGGAVCIEDIELRHVLAFTALCRALPNRWGRTTAEKAGGIAASLLRAQTMGADEVGISQTTINKHITWVVAVLYFAAGDSEAEGHRPTQPLSFKNARSGIGKKARQQRKRDRDKRANWTKQEVARLLSAPIWTGSAGIDQRLAPGSEIIHDAWYWLPLMLPLYGGRSSELAGLALNEVH